MDRNTEQFLYCEDSSAGRLKIYSDGDVWTSDAGTLTSDETLKENTPFTRNQIVEFLEKNRIATRKILAGNLVKQPAYLNKKHRIVSGLKNTDYLMNNSFWFGVYPGINDTMKTYVIDVINVPGVLCFSTFSKTCFMMSSLSITTSIIQSQSLIFCRSSLKLPVSILSA